MEDGRVVTACQQIRIIQPRHPLPPPFKEDGRSCDSLQIRIIQPPPPTHTHTQDKVHVLKTLKFYDLELGNWVR